MTRLRSPGYATVAAPRRVCVSSEFLSAAARRLRRGAAHSDRTSPVDGGRCTAVDECICKGAGRCGSGHLTPKVHCAVAIPPIEECAVDSPGLTWLKIWAVHVCACQG